MSRKRGINGRTKRTSKKKTVKISHNDTHVHSANGSSETTNFDSNALIQQLLHDAESEIDAFNYESAAESCNEVLKLDSENTKALEMLAGIMLENGNLAESENLLLRCIDLSPRDGYSKYFSMAQLSSDERALNFFKKGISIIEERMKNSEHSDSEVCQEANLRRALSDAYCSIVELYMTDLCFYENAEELCKVAVESAVEADPSNYEAYQCLANYQLIINNTEEARSTMKQSLSLWLPQYQTLLESQVPSDTVNSYQPPSYDSRISGSKLLIELEMFNEASEVLEGLVTEDDEVVEVWYLLGWLNYVQDDEYKRNAYYYFKKAQKVYSKTKVAVQDQLAHIEELMREMGKKYESDEDETEENFPSDSDSDELET